MDATLSSSSQDPCMLSVICLLLVVCGDDERCAHPFCLLTNPLSRSPAPLLHFVLLPIPILFLLLTTTPCVCSAGIALFGGGQERRGEFSIPDEGISEVHGRFLPCAAGWRPCVRQASTAALPQERHGGRGPQSPQEMQ